MDITSLQDGHGIGCQKIEGERYSAVQLKKSAILESERFTTVQLKPF